MIAKLFIPSHGILKWIDNLPENFTGKRLPGARVHTATGLFGSVCLQLYKDEGFFYLYIVLQLTHPLLLQVMIPPTGLLLWSQLLGGPLTLQTEGNEQLHREMHSCLYTAVQKLSLQPETSGAFEFLAVWYNAGQYREVVDSFADLFHVDNSTAQASTYQNAVVPTSLALRELMEQVLHCPYPPPWRPPYYRIRASDILFQFLVDISHSDPTPMAYTTEEATKIHSAEKVIVEDLTAHTIIPKLARKVGMNEQRFKMVFKMIYGKGPFEYLREKRLEKAVELLQRGEMVKVAALETGWRPADLIKAYKARYGVTPTHGRRKR